MHILVTTTTYPKSNKDTSPRFVHDLCKGFKKKEVTPIVLTPHSYGLETKDTIDNITIFRYKYFFEKYELISGNGIVNKIKKKPFLTVLIPFLMFFQFIAIFKLIKKYDIDIILANWIVPQGLIAIFVKKLLKKEIKIYIISHGGDAKLLNSNSILKRIGNFVMNNATKTIAVSSYVKKTLSEISRKNLKFNTIPMGVDIDKFNNNKEIEKKKYDLIFVGRLEEKKGVKILIDAIKELSLKDLYFNVIIIGSGTLKNSLQKRTSEYNLNNSITFTGSLTHEQIVEYMSLSKIFILPSIDLSYDSEGLPTVLLEAMAMGLAIITTDAGGITDVAKNDYNSILIEQNNVKMLSEKIETLINNPSELKKLKLNALKTAKEYSYENIVERYYKVIKEIYG